MKHVTLKDNTLYLSCVIRPNANENKVVGLYNDAIKIKIKAVPENNKANEELISFLSKLLDTNRKNIEILSGEKETHKIIAVRGCLEIPKIFSELPSS